MTYQLKRTDGTLLAEVVENTIDVTATDLTLIGKNFVSYGQYLNENFVKILQNFANDQEPTRALDGQLWYDTTVNKIKVYDGSRFKPLGGAIVSPTQPVNLVAGDLWINSATNQFYGFDGSQLSLIGPIFTVDQGQSGFSTETILDSRNLPRTIVKLWNGGVLLGIISYESVAFTPRDEIDNFAGLIQPGFNQSLTEGFKIYSRSSLATGLIRDSDGALRTPSVFMSTEGNTGTIGSVTLSNSVPLILGANEDVTISNSLSTFTVDTKELDFKISTRGTSALVDAIRVTSDAVFLYTRSNKSIKADELYLSTSLFSTSFSNVEATHRYINLNANEDGAGVSQVYAGISVDRGTFPTVSLRWNDDLDRWEWTPDGSIYYRVLTDDSLALAAKTGSWLDVVDRPQFSNVWTSNIDGVYTTASHAGIKNGVPAYPLDVAGVARIHSLFNKSSDLGVLEEIDVMQGHVFVKEMLTNTSFTVINVPNGSISFILKLIDGGSYDITWWEGLNWSQGSPPELSLIGIDILAFATSNSGLTWVGSLLGKNFKLPN